ncbi:MAG: beta-propeller domain-containing protein [Candidatus Bathyarchaeales archaeon]
MQRQIKQKTGIYGVIAVFLAVSLGLVVLNLSMRFTLPSVSALNTFSSYEELETYLKNSQKTPYYYVKVLDVPKVILPPGQIPTPTFFKSVLPQALDATTVGVPESGPQYSSTNVQVAGVDEADTVKTDGEYIYIVSGNNVTILKAFPTEEAQIVSRISLNGTVQGIFINDDILAVFEQSFFYLAIEPYYAVNATEMLPLDLSYFPYSVGSETFVRLYDVSDKSAPSLKQTVSIDGTYFSSRMIGEYVYLVVNQPVYWKNSRILPITLSWSTGTETAPANKIYYANMSDNSYAFVTVVAINMFDLTKPEYKIFLLGEASSMYVSLNNIYITMPRWRYEDSLVETLVYRIRIQEDRIEEAARGKVPGTARNQFSMDEYNGYFRIATTIGFAGLTGLGPKNNLYVLDANLAIVGKLEDLAPGETIHSARFMGDKCYLVTFRKIDPFFVIDLANPADPRVLGQLKISGYSNYLHPYDENHIIGIGKETVAGDGEFSWYQGVKISLFDVTDVENPIEIKKWIIGDRGTESPVLTDHKALLFDKAKNLLVIPVLVAEKNETTQPEPWQYGEIVYQGAFIFTVNSTELILRGQITHIKNATELGYCYGHQPHSYYIYRSLYIDDVLYTISEKRVKMNSLATLEEINEIQLP